ncbi:MAG: ribose-phosphate pyrophosphokinase, partial [Candidatus Micrarchaeota archaeon]
AIMHGTAHPELAREIARVGKIPIIETKVTRFNNGEVSVKDTAKSVRGKHIFLVQTGGRDINNELMETLIMIDSLKRAGVGKVTVVLPHYPYGRQERKAGEREPISAALVARLLHKAGAHSLVSIDLHAKSIQGFFPGNFENLRVQHLVKRHLMKTLGKKYKEAIIVSPDVGGLPRVEGYANSEGLGLGVFHKKRPKPGKSEINMYKGPGKSEKKMYMGPSVRGKTAVLFDDMIDTGGSIVNAAKQLRKQGAKRVLVYATHPIFTGDAEKLLNEARQIEKVVVTDSIPVKPNGKIEVMPIAPFLSQVIHAISRGHSVSKLMKL